MELPCPDCGSTATQCPGTIRPPTQCLWLRPLSYLKLSDRELVDIVQSRYENSTAPDWPLALELAKRLMSRRLRPR